MKRFLPITLALCAAALCLAVKAQGPSDGTRSSGENKASNTTVQRSLPSSVYRLIVHPSSEIDEITRSRLSQLLLKKSTRWEDGQRAIPIDLSGNSEIRKTLSKEIHGRSLASIKSFWQRQIFSGTTVPPPEMGTDQEVLDFVRRQPGSVGYISAQTPFDGVKELFLVEE